MLRRGISPLLVVLLALGMGCSKSTTPIGGKPKPPGGDTAAKPDGGAAPSSDVSAGE